MLARLSPSFMAPKQNRKSQLTTVLVLMVPMIYEGMLYRLEFKSLLYELFTSSLNSHLNCSEQNSPSIHIICLCIHIYTASFSFG